MGDTMKDMRLVYDLESYLRENHGIHPIFTGTFDPPHIQHVAPLLNSRKRLEERGVANPWLLMPHTRNGKKKPTARLSQRREWLLQTIDFFAPEIAHRVKLVIGMGEPDQPYLYDLPEELQERLLRIAGNDKEGEIQDGRIQTLFVDRAIDMSSTRIRELMKQTKSHSELRLALAPRVLEAVIEAGYWQKPKA
jgi:nicotinic acid mononucleotide adenylyltransferase